MESKYLILFILSGRFSFFALVHCQLLTASLISRCVWRVSYPLEGVAMVLLDRELQ